jgi:hypothetical protein
MNKQLRIYVAGPLHPSKDSTELDQLMNVRNAIDVGVAIFKKGHRPFIPHLFYVVQARAYELKTPLTTDELMKWDHAWLMQCNALFYMGPSRGADSEFMVAHSRKIPIFTDLKEIPKVEDGQSYRDIFGGFLADDWASSYPEAT